jgi:hypothetical protein
MMGFLKQCSKCKKVKYWFEFSKDNLNAFSIRTDCKKCCSKSFKQYHLKNKEKIATIKKQYCLENKEKIATKSKQYHIKNKGELAKKRKLYCSKNKEKIAIKSKQYHKKYYKKHRSKILESNSKYYQNNKTEAKVRVKLYQLKNKEKIKEYHRKKAKIASYHLKNYYMKQRLRYIGFKNEEITKKLIILYRYLLVTKRIKSKLRKEMKNGKRDSNTRI